MKNSAGVTKVRHGVHGAKLFFTFKVFRLGICDYCVALRYARWADGGDGFFLADIARWAVRCDRSLFIEAAQPVAVLVCFKMPRPL